MHGGGHNSQVISRKVNWCFTVSIIHQKFLSFGIQCSNLSLISFPSSSLPTLQMFRGNCRDFAGKSECRDFKFRGIACIPSIPVILKFPHYDFHSNICREFEFTGILWGFPALDVGKPCNNLIFGDIHAKFAGISCKF